MSDACIECGSAARPCLCEDPRWQCALCKRWLGRQVNKGTHYNCRLALGHSLGNLGKSLAIAAGLCRAFQLGQRFGVELCPCGDPLNTEELSWLRGQFFTPGCGRSAP